MLYVHTLGHQSRLSFLVFRDPVFKCHNGKQYICGHFEFSCRFVQDVIHLLKDFYELALMFTVRSPNSYLILIFRLFALWGICKRIFFKNMSLLSHAVILGVTLEV